MKEISESDLKQLDSRYKLIDKFLESSSFVAYFATDNSSQKDVIVFIHRYLHDPYGMFATRFPARQKKIAEASSIFNPLSYAVSTSGLAYIILPKVEGRSLSSFKGLGVGAEALFCKLIVAIKEIHNEDISLGDISSDSFIVDANDNLHLLGSFGYLFDKSPKIEDRLAQYLSPEQFSSERFDLRSDVFAIGAIGYKLFTGHFVREVGGENPLLDPAKNAPAPSSFDSKISPWVDAAIGACLSGDRQKRFSSAIDLADSVKEGIERGLVPGGANPWLSRTVTKKALDNKSSATTPNLTDGNFSLTKFLPILVAITFALVSLFFILRPKDESTTIVIEKDELISTLIELSPDELKEDISLLKDKALPVASIITVLDRVSKSNSPVAIMLLHSAMRGEIGEGLPQNGELRSFALKKYIEKLNAQGLQRGSLILSNWLSVALTKAETFSITGLFESCMQAVDLARDPKSRRAAIQKIFEYDPDFAILLTTALILDGQGNDKEEFKPVVRIFLQSRNIPNSHGRSFEELLLAYPKTVSAFLNDVKILAKDLKNNQLSWVLQATLSQKSKISYEILEEVVKRDIVPPYQKVFLEPLVGEGRNTLPENIVGSLMSAALGDISINTLQNLSTWGGKSFERVFLSFAAIAPEKQLSFRAIEILAQRSVDSEPAKTLLSWLEKQPRESKEEIAKAIGILSLIDIASEDDVSYAFNTMLSYSGGRELFNSAMVSNSHRLQQEVVDRVGPIMPFNDLLPLLRHENPIVRAAAVRLLKGNNNITVLNEIARGYERETDQSVRSAYEAEHWVIQERTQ